MFEFIVQLIGYALVDLFSKEDKVRSFKTPEEKIAWEKEQRKLDKQLRRQRQEQWLKERAQLIKAAGLDPENPEHVKKWKAARRAQYKAQQEKITVQPAHPILHQEDAENYASNQPYITALERRREEREDMKVIIQRERHYLSDEEIRERHEGYWGRGETDQAFKEVDDQSFLSWLLWG